MPGNRRFTDQQVYDENQLREFLALSRGTYGVNPLLCLQGLKDVLIDNGMQVFESTEMLRLEDHTAYTHGGSITANHIIIAVDIRRRGGLQATSKFNDTHLQWPLWAMPSLVY